MTDPTETLRALEEMEKGLHNVNVPDMARTIVRRALALAATLVEERLGWPGTCRPNFPHVAPCGPTHDTMDCACGCAGDDRWCYTENLAELQARLAQVEGERNELDMRLDMKEHQRLRDNQYLIDERDALRAQLAQLGKDHLELLQDRNQLETRLAQVEDENRQWQEAMAKSDVDRNRALSEATGLRAQLTEARDTLNPVCEDESLLGAIRNLQQVVLSQKGNVTELESQLAAMGRAAKLLQAITVRPADISGGQMYDEAVSILSALRETGGMS